MRYRFIETESTVSVTRSWGEGRMGELMVDEYGVSV
jgi:hypothetical protein